MRAGRVWVGFGGLAAALALGSCEQRQEAEGTGGSGEVSTTIQQAQEKSKEAFEKAQAAQQEAIAQQEEAAEAKKEVAEVRTQLEQTRQKAREEAQQARQAQQEAQQESQRAQQTAQRAQQEAQAGQQQAQREFQQQSQPGAQAQVAQAQELNGQVSSASESQIVIETQDRGAITLQVDPTTEVLIDGQRSSVGELETGAEVRASFNASGGEQTATRIEAQSAGGSQQQPRQQPQPESEQWPQPIQP